MKSGRAKPEKSCEHCGEPLRAARVSVYRRRGRQHVLFERVAALVCRACGHRVFEAAAVEAMEHVLTQPGARGRTARLLVVSA